ncbi:hypothetical protein E2F50_09400 [Rhizobium deserti]|uniref:Uncharacterized protein n=1 Tax=Rhizobium deserti TaxID=2547961 RepID=A0A4R5UK13_9HYPH|nr:hypothetical protein [Rhizobium deserti]TDK37103.1 hypothetical protein E2F50_09400 [Rhizobium deserti]
MTMETILKVTALTALLASTMTPPSFTGFTVTASAKEGNGGGNGGGNGNGNSGGQGKSNSGNSNQAERSRERGSAAKRNNVEKQTSASAENERPRKAATSLPSPSEPKGLNSLNRNYRAYLNSNDPKMAAVSAYAKAYAQYEADTGMAPSASDPALGDDALRDALGKFTGAPIDDETLAYGKAVLGVGTAEGKIDQLRAEIDD